MKVVIKSLVPATLLFAAFQLLSAQAAITDSAYANASLYLTSTASQQTATATSTVPVGYANAYAEPGLMDNAVLTSGSPGLSSTAFTNESVSGFSDKLTINDSAYTGLTGTMQFSFEVSGTYFFTAASPAISEILTSATFTAPGVSDDLAFTHDSTGATTGADFLDIEQTVNVPFIFGQPFTINLAVDIAGLVEDLSGGSALVSGSFTTTAGTGAVTPAVLSTPLPASSYSEKSASGANYELAEPSAVPEPNGLLLVAGGAAALTLLKMRRRRR